MHSISRALSALRLIAGASDGGLRSGEVAAGLGLHKSSASRLLATLVSLGAVVRDRNRRFRLDESFRITFGTPARTTRLRQAARLPLGILSERLEEATFLSVRSGLDSLCIERHIGTFPIQALSLNVGGRRPLGVGAGSLALLAALPDPECAETLELQRGRLDRYRMSVEDIAAQIGPARVLGYAALPPGFVVQGMTGVAIAVRDPSGLVVAALSVAAINERLAGERLELAAAALREAASLCELRLRQGAGDSAAGDDLS